MALGGRNEATVIDVESLAYCMESKMRNSFSLSPNHCIFRTPSILFRHREEAYIPNCFSFGPFHHNKENLKVTENIKNKYLKGLLSRSVNPAAMLRECLDSIKKVERKARECYAGHIDQNIALTQNFVEMLVLDGCFIVELFRKLGGVVPKEKDDPIFSMTCMLQYLYHDLILLENQIPWFVMELLFNKTKGPSKTPSLIELTLHFLGNVFQSYFTPTIDTRPFVNEEVKHILDLLRLNLVLHSEEVESYGRKWWWSQWQPFPSVARLKEAGVKFVRVNVDCILDIKFRNGVLEIPPLLIQETTETIFRNLISYEHCLPNCLPIITSYAKIMKNLIDTTSDMEILCKKGILKNWLSPKDATELFNELCYDTHVKKFYYIELSSSINHHCQQWWSRWRAYYIQNYIKSRWSIVGQLYAVVMLVLTFWQTYIKKG
ncbi:hypothetical protein PTKIN_Ptkin08bG0012000 [Pterospermum kingtungense]